MASSRIFQIFLRVAVQNQVRFVDKVLNTQPSGTSRNCHFRRKRKIRTLLQSETGSDFSCLVGAGGFEPPKLKSSRFTVCPHWPLGNTPIFFSQSVPDCLYILPLPRGFVKFFAANYFAGMRAASSQKKNTRTLNGFRCLKWSW